MFELLEKITLGAILALCLAAGLSAPAFAGAPADWSKVPTKTVKLFYPGQSSYQWLRSPAHKRANKKVLKGDSCVSCHEGEEEDMGKLLVSGKKLEPAPIPGKEGVKDLAVQAAHDGTYLYLRLNWKTQLDREGRMHNMVRYDGKKWAFYGSHRANSKVRDGKEPPLYEDRMAIMIDDGSVPMFAEQGCWLTCHTAMRDMPDMAKKDQVKAHALLGKALKKSDVRKYLPLTRIDGVASWDKTKSPADIAKIKAAGGFVDLMQWRVARSNATGRADDGYVLEYRLTDAGKNVFTWNLNRKTMIPKFMFDSAKTGYIALRESDFSDPAKSIAIVEGVNAKPYDANAGFKEGDILPGRLLVANPEGSAADNDSVKGVWKDGAYTLVFRRKLNTGHPGDDKILKVGGVYTVGFGVHDDNVTTRFHHVSFPITLGIGAKAGITAISIK